MDTAKSIFLSDFLFLNNRKVHNGVCPMFHKSHYYGGISAKNYLLHSRLYIPLLHRVVF